VGATGESNSNDRTLTHEIGHFLSLCHPWGCYTGVEDPNNCYEDDDIEDTPNTIGNYSTCNLDNNTCNDGFGDKKDNVQNIMDYSSCPIMFTYGQKDVMRATLNASLSGRNNLWSEANLIATGTNNDYVHELCVPIAEFGADETQTCANSSIELFDFSYNGDVETWYWTFEGGTPANSTDSAVEVIYENPGVYDVTLTVSNAAGENTITKTDLITIIDTYAGFSLPMAESFEDASFPENTENETKNWIIEAGSDETWEYTDSASATGTGSVRIKNQLITDETLNTLVSPNINLRDFTPESISFNLAFVYRTSSSNGELKIYISKNCGINWQLVYAKSGNQLVTNVHDYITDSFTPASDEWRQETISNSTFENEDHIMIKFVNKSLGGNYLYIDDVVINKIVGVEEPGFGKSIRHLQIFPNPFIDDATISYSLSEKQKLSFEVFSLIGKQLGKYSIDQDAGEYNMYLSDIIPDLNSGIFMIKLSTGNKSATRRIIKY